MKKYSISGIIALTLMLCSCSDNISQSGVISESTSTPQSSADDAVSTVENAISSEEDNAEYVGLTYNNLPVLDIVDHRITRPNSDIPPAIDKRYIEYKGEEYLAQQVSQNLYVFGEDSDPEYQSLIYAAEKAQLDGINSYSDWIDYISTLELVGYSSTLSDAKVDYVENYISDNEKCLISVTPDYDKTGFDGYTVWVKQDSSPESSGMTYKELPVFDIVDVDIHRPNPDKNPGMYGSTYIEYNNEKFVGCFYPVVFGEDSDPECQSLIYAAEKAQLDGISSYSDWKDYISTLELVGYSSTLSDAKVDYVENYISDNGKCLISVTPDYDSTDFDGYTVWVKR